MNSVTRRAVLQTVTAGLAAVARGDESVRVRAITRGPRFHWFGYYDKLEFDPTGRYVLGNEVAFEGRAGGPDDAITVGLVDTGDGDKWRALGTTRAWSWQQAAMLQWVPGTKSRVIWNDREGEQFVSRVADASTGKVEHTVPAPVHCLRPDGKFALHEDFRRLQHLRPGYGYAGPRDPYFDERAPAKSGLFRVDLQTGKEELLLSLAQAAALPYKGQAPAADAKHWFNHVLYAPNGKRFIVLHRWELKGKRGSFATRMITADHEGGNVYVVDPYGQTSHFIWRDDEHILAWAGHPSLGEKFYLYRDRTEEVAAVGPDVMTVNGHCTYLPGNRWILNDTYPDAARLQHLFLYEVATGKRVSLGDYLSPQEYAGEWRCDLHPRASRDGRRVVFDSTHAGQGRQMYLVDIAGLVS